MPSRPVRVKLKKFNRYILCQIHPLYREEFKHLVKLKGSTEEFSSDEFKTTVYILDKKFADDTIYPKFFSGINDPLAEERKFANIVPDLACTGTGTYVVPANTVSTLDKAFNSVILSVSNSRYISKSDLKNIESWIDPVKIWLDNYYVNSLYHGIGRHKRLVDKDIYIMNVLLEEGIVDSSIEEKSIPTNKDNVFIYYNKKLENVEQLSIIEKFIRNQPLEESTFISKINKELLKHYTASSKHINQEVEQLEDKLANAYKQKGQIDFGLNAVKKNSKETIRKLISDIRSLSDVSLLKFTARGIIVSTNSLFIDFKDKRYYCGEFDIMFDFLTENVYLGYLNKASPRKGHSNPHGSCTGSYYSAIMSSLKRMDYYTVILTVIEMLKNVNPEDSGAVSNLRHYFSAQSKPSQTYENDNPINIISKRKDEIARERNRTSRYQDEDDDED